MGSRFRSCLIQSETYVLTCYRYIELNPVRAAMVNRPENDRWSSYHANAQGKADLLIEPHAEYLRLAPDETDRREAYRTLFKAPLDAVKLDEIRKSTNGNFALGSERFKEEIEVALKRRARRRHPGRPRCEAGDADV